MAITMTDTRSSSTQAALCNYRVMLTIGDPTDFSFERLQTKNELQAALRGIALSLRAIIDADMIIYSPISMYVIHVCQGSSH